MYSWLSTLQQLANLGLRITAMIIPEILSPVEHPARMLKIPEIADAISQSLMESAVRSMLGPVPRMKTTSVTFMIFLEFVNSANTKMTNSSLDRVLTVNEAAELYGVSQDTIKSACAGQHGFPPRFTPDECRKSGRYWLVTRAGMERLYGPAKNR